MAVSRYKKRGRRAGAVHLQRHSKTAGQRWHGFMRDTATGINLSTQEAAQQAEARKADAVLPWECERCGGLWGPFQTYCKTCGPLIEIATETDYRRFMEEHERGPRRCCHGDCEAIPEEEDDLCAFHDELYERSDSVDARSWVPIHDVGGRLKWDGFNSFTVDKRYIGPEESIGEWRPRPRFWSVPTPWSAGGGIAFNPSTLLPISPEWADAGWRPRVMFSKGGQLARLRAAIERGLGIRAAAREVGCHKATATKLHSILLAERARDGLGVILCACGRASTHRGWCSHRFQKSPTRQRAMEVLQAGARAYRAAKNSTSEAAGTVTRAA